MNGVAPTHRTLQVKVLLPMMVSLTGELRADLGSVPRPGQEAVDQVLKKPKFQEIGLQGSLERSLGIVEQGPDFVTVGVGAFVKTAANTQVSSRVALSCFFLVRRKIVLLVVSGREAAAAEVEATEAILGEWRSVMRTANR